MAYSTDMIKDVLSNFLDEKMKNSKNANTAGSLALLQLEKLVTDIRDEYGIHEKFDLSLFSMPMLKKSTDTSAGAAFRPADYEYNFLHFLALHFEPTTADLHRCINRFLEKYAPELSLADIVLTRNKKWNSPNRQSDC